LLSRRLGRNTSRSRGDGSRWINDVPAVRSWRRISSFEDQSSVHVKLKLALMHCHHEYQAERIPAASWATVDVNTGT
jgi:hypothetical protein